MRVGSTHTQPRIRHGCLVQFHQKRNFDVVLLAVTLSPAGWVGQCVGECPLYCITHVPRTDVSRTHIAERTVGIHSREDRPLNPALFISRAGGESGRQDCGNEPIPIRVTAGLGGGGGAATGAGGAGGTGGAILYSTLGGSEVVVIEGAGGAATTTSTGGT